MKKNTGVNPAAISKRLKIILSKETFLHVAGTAGMAARLAERFGGDRNKAKIAGLLHDCAKDMSRMEMLEAIKKYSVKISGHDRKIPAIWHGLIGEKIAGTEFGIKDRRVLCAIKMHSIGGSRMGKLEKIIYVSDFIEPGRKYRESSELRELLDKDITLDFMVLCVLKSKIMHLKKNKLIIHPSTKLLFKQLGKSGKHNRNN
jgi:predicted HD superfamily hydrolase involved in NAD metabolism